MISFILLPNQSIGETIHLMFNNVPDVPGRVPEWIAVGPAKLKIEI